ncbi:riboflavin-binding protein-like [Scleropages formosus]|uniref:Retbindin n=1 Tax=Scleropages formosus TaxID=113540 RepID=A0A8C9RS04_SCLFO|nr:riboflavin-binding protein-like [Scleropages formosus]
MPATYKPSPLIFAYFSALIIGCAWGQRGACPRDGKHKATPSPEPQLTECRLYADNACCTVDDLQDLVAPSVPGVESGFWDRCGALSPPCEGFLKRVACFQRCSPDAVHWTSPRHSTTAQAVPLCHSFCREWYEACKTDLTCARNWMIDWKGRNCTGNCVPYRQMYQHERDLCESLWGDHFVTMVDEEGDQWKGRTCGCLTLSPSDREVVAAHQAQEQDLELDTTKAGLPQYRDPHDAQRQIEAALLVAHNRMAPDNMAMDTQPAACADGTDGSGSGF